MDIFNNLFVSIIKSHLYNEKIIYKHLKNKKST